MRRMSVAMSDPFELALVKAELEDRGLPHRIADGLRPGHARLVRRVEEHRSRGQAGYAGDEFCRGEEVAGRGGILKAPGKALRAS